MKANWEMVALWASRIALGLIVYIGLEIKSDVETISTTVNKLDKSGALLEQKVDDHLKAPGHEKLMEKVNEIDKKVR